MAAIFVGCAATGPLELILAHYAQQKNKIIWIYFLQDWTLGESQNILMYDIATYACANVEKMANSQVHLDARLDYSNLYCTRLISTASVCSGWNKKRH